MSPLFIFLLVLTLASAADLQVLIEMNEVEEVLAYVSRNGLDGRDFSSFQTPLMMAATAGKPDVIRALLEAGADATIRDDRGNGPADAAAFFGRFSTIEALIQGSAEVDAVATDGLRPIDRACNQRSRAHAKVFQLLLDNGADPDGSVHGVQVQHVSPCLVTSNEHIAKVMEARLVKSRRLLTVEEL